MQSGLSNVSILTHTTLQVNIDYSSCFRTSTWSLNPTRSPRRINWTGSNRGRVVWNRGVTQTNIGRIIFKDDYFAVSLTSSKYFLVTLFKFVVVQLTFVGVECISIHQSIFWKAIKSDRNKMELSQQNSAARKWRGIILLLIRCNCSKAR